MHMTDKVEKLVGIPDLVVVPRDYLDKGIGESDAGLLVEDLGAGIADEIGGNNVVFGVTEDTLKLVF